MGLVIGGELDEALGCCRGLLLKLRGPPPELDGVTASNADPSPDGKLYGAKRWFELAEPMLPPPPPPFNACNGDTGEWPE